jgi:hypothetical protein
VAAIGAGGFGQQDVPGLDLAAIEHPGVCLEEIAKGLVRALGEHELVPAQRAPTFVGRAELLNVPGKIHPRDRAISSDPGCASGAERLHCIPTTENVMGLLVDGVWQDDSHDKGRIQGGRFNRPQPKDPPHARPDRAGVGEACAAGSGDASAVAREVLRRFEDRTLLVPSIT